MLSRIIWMIVCIIVTYFLGKLAWNNLNNHKFIRSIFQGAVAFVALMLALGPIINYEDAHEKTTSAADTASSSSKPSSSSKDDDSSDEKESDEVAKARVKNTCDALNDEMSKHSELDGFSMKPSGDQFKVTVPSSATALSDNEQKSLYKSVVDLIYSYDNGTNQGSYVEFDGDDGMPVAHYSYIGDKIKLDN
ncbi:hypothetical protein HQ33_07435 [Limosilactobacillus reuteri]|nr:hypothetical protein HQ33_07435 [Limosilactobacillus reuteri]